jgi:phage gp29-like protein
MSKRNKRNKNTATNKLNAVTSAIENETSKTIISEQIATRQNSSDFMTSLMGTLPNPDPILKKLNKTIEVYEDLMYDSRVKATTESRKSAVLSMEWEIVGKNPEAELLFYTDLFNKWTMEDKVSEMLDAALFGYKPFEIIWGIENGKVIPFDFIGKPPRWFGYDQENNLRFYSESHPFEGEPVSMDNFIVVRKNPTYDNPHGKAALSPCFWPVIFRKNGFKFWTIFVEKFGMPFLLAKAPEGAKETEIEAVADMLEDMVQDAIAVTPKGYEVEIAEAAQGKGSGDSIHKVYIEKSDTEIAMAILGTNLTTEVSGGSLAASQSHMEVRKDIIESDRRLVEGGFNELIKKTHTMNFTSEPPKIRFFAEEDIDKTLAERDKLILDGNPEFKFTPEYYQKKYNLEDTDFEIKEVEPEIDNKNNSEK